MHDALEKGNGTRIATRVILSLFLKWVCLKIVREQGGLMGYDRDITERFSQLTIISKQLL